MNRFVGRRRQPSRRIGLILATLAVVMLTLVPRGFMVAPRSDLPFPVVICTAQGAVTVDPGQPLPGHSDRDEEPGGGEPDRPCAFAAAVTSAEPPTTTLVAVEPFAPAPTESRAREAAPVPGRGLAAPPLPARGPPSC